jgi:hypothetical protein
MTTNYKPIVNDFLLTMQDNNWTIGSVDDGEAVYVINKPVPKGSSIGQAKISAKNKALKHIMSVDESAVTFTKLVDTGRTSHLLADQTVLNHMRINALIILGNEPDELVADWSSSGNDADAEFNKAYEEFTKKYEIKI